MLLFFKDNKISKRNKSRKQELIVLENSLS